MHKDTYFPSIISTKKSYFLEKQKYGSFYFSTFAAVKLTTKRYLFTWILLATIVPMLLMSSLHIHEQGESSGAACIECANGHCGGHLTQMTTTMHQCVLCQFLTLTFLSFGVVTLIAINRAVNVRPDAQQRHVCLAYSGIVGLRAPPMVSI